jgi:hypothetical protein
LIVSDKQKNEKEHHEQEEEKNSSISIAIRFPEKFFKVASAISVLGGYDSFEEYLLEVIQDDVETLLDGRSSALVDIDHK